MSGAELDRAEVYAMIDSLGDAGRALAEESRVSLVRLSKALDLGLRF
ncbi:hypothetical protein GCM10009613_34660 [Pseudonocardia kongjuensis]|uniref:Uncharacterized protein n=1 Tax=Pseudonocardia kongjuensis TaxID=102227 RepID=A0ABN1XW51_9PSEU